jgi:hypothetical protein
MRSLFLSVVRLSVVRNCYFSIFSSFWAWTTTDRLAFFTLVCLYGSSHRESKLTTGLLSAFEDLLTSQRHTILHFNLVCLWAGGDPEGWVHMIHAYTYDCVFGCVCACIICLCVSVLFVCAVCVCVPVCVLFLTWDTATAAKTASASAIMLQACRDCRHGVG